MGRVRVRWQGLVRVAVAAALCLVGLKTVPGLLEPPQAPPLAADVGLPRVAPGPEPAVAIEQPRRPARKPRGRRATDRSAATATIGTTPRGRPRKPGPSDPARPHRDPPHRAKSIPTPAPAAPPPVAAPAPVDPPAPVPTPAPEPAPSPGPEPMPAPPPSPPRQPGDGSVEFAPR